MDTLQIRLDFSTTALTMSHIANYTSDGTTMGMEMVMVSSPETGNNIVCNSQPADGALVKSPLADAKLIGVASWYGQDTYEWFFSEEDVATTVYTSVDNAQILGISSYNLTANENISRISFLFQTDTVAPGTFIAPTTCYSVSEGAELGLAGDAAAAKSKSASVTQAVSSLLAYVL